ncbi:hypothetical protein GPECTOR_23g137 [Gonium pectorale]|uniref:Pseudouridine synthase RsuA/RluA-like domain-containing protein n=1 Tax=Gonium pectorale TaxID=33097 RepID=A0A150GGT2_GONPE|nr:hypothetical protein GPECTOR_23g137 [Gonium pectorale]|eukprot:KXZ49051.1 hypothetical protein GPECTOR_23g137 [Gonium pectorale]
MRRVGDVASYTRRPWREPDSPSHVDVLYEDEHMVALSKPSGLQVLPAAMFHQRTVLALLRTHYGGAQQPEQRQTAAAEEEEEKGERQQQQRRQTAGEQGQTQPSRAGGLAAAGSRRSRGDRPEGRQRQQRAVPAPVHRLGRGTSGLLLCARTPEARRRLTELMTDKTAAAAEAAAAASAATEAGAAAAEAAAPTPARASGLVGAATIAEAVAERLVPCPGGPGGGGAVAAAAAPGAAGGGPPLRKLYRALVQGRVAADQGRVDVPIGPIAHPGVDGGLFAATPLGKPAASIWRVLERRPPPPQPCRLGPPWPTGQAAAAAAAPGGCVQAGRAEEASAGDGGSAGGLPLEAAAASGAGGAAWAGAADVAPGREGAREEWRGWRGEAPEAEAEADDQQEQTLMEVEILTGRPHQIRIHMAAMGHPLVGDPLYGVGGVPRAGADASALAGEEAGGPAPAEGGHGRPGDCGYHLHSLELRLPHPITGQPLALRAPPPPLLMTAAERAEEEAAAAVHAAEAEAGVGMGMGAAAKAAGAG